MIRNNILLVFIICSVSVISSCSNEKSKNGNTLQNNEPEIVYQSDFTYDLDTNRVKGTHINAYFPDKSENKKDYLVKWSKSTVSDYNMYVVLFFSHRDSIPEIDIPTGINDPLYSSNCFAIFKRNEKTLKDEFFYVKNMKRINI